MSQPIQMRIAHQVAGRTRLVATDTVTLDVLVACRDRLAETEGVRVEARPGSRSLVVNHGQAWASLSGVLEQAGVSITSHAPHTPVEQTKALLATLNDTMGRATAGRFDLINITFVVLVLGGLLQASRGNLGGPAATLFTQALSIALLCGRRAS